MYELNLYTLPPSRDGLTLYRRLLEREVWVRPYLLLIDCQRLLAANERTEPEADIYLLRSWLDHLIRELPARCVLSVPQAITLPMTSVQYQHLPALSQTEQMRLWQHCLALDESGQTPALTPALETTLQGLSAQFNLTGQQVRAIAHHARATAEDPQSLNQSLWRYSREKCRQPLQGLARAIPPGSLGWDDLILPSEAIKSLQAILAQVKQRQRVYQQWGFARHAPCGLGIHALFTGSSGTGKTLAAHTIASQLRILG